MRTQTSWNEQEDNLKAARVLAQFANQEPDDDGIRFIQKHRGFFPRTVWFKHLLAGRRTRLLEAWDSRFPMNKVLALIKDFEVFSEEVENSILQPPKPTPFHRAIFFLHINPWRAKKCQFCGRRFIAAHSQNRFCSFGGMTAPDGTETNCSWAYRKKYKAKKWIEHSESTNARRRREYRVKQNRRRRGNAKRKNIRQR